MIYSILLEKMPKKCSKKISTNKLSKKNRSNDRARRNDSLEFR